MRCAISAGHGYMTAGKRTCPFPDGRQMREHEFNRDVAFALDYKLRQAGHETVLCFDEIGVTDMLLADRVAKANRAKADIYVSVHANALGDGKTWHSVNGLVAMTYPGSEAGRKLARCILPEISKITGMPIQSYQETAYWEPKNTTMPCAIIECGFMTNYEDAKKLITYEYRQQVAEGIYNGIEQYFGSKTNVLPTNEPVVIELPKATLNTLKTNRSVKSLAKEYKNFVNGMFFSWTDNSLYDLCISNEVYLENKMTNTPKGSFYLYTDGRCGVIDLRTIPTKDIQMLVQGINLKDLSRSYMNGQGWSLIDPKEISRGAAIGYDYKTDKIKIVILKGTLFDMQKACRDNGLVDKNSDICAISFDRGGSFAFVDDGKVIYDTDRYMRSIIMW